MNQYNINLITYKCPFCSRNAVNTKFTNILQCNKCKIMFQRRDTITNNTAEVYNIDYFQGKVYKNYFNEELERKQRFVKKIELINYYLPQEGRVLDIGCAAGFFLKVMKDIGYDAYGLDISSTAYDYLMNHYDFKIFRGDIFEAEYKDKLFDIITLWDVLEHLIDPELVLDEIYRILKKQGVLVIETLNIDSLNFKLLQNRWPLFFPDYHLFYYNKKFLIKLLNKIGFTVKKIFPIQTYICLKKYTWTISYFDRPLLSKVLGCFLDDVILIVAEK